MLWTPPADARERTNMGRFLTFVNERTGQDLADFDALMAWSIAEVEQFWAAIWDFFEVRAHTPYETVLRERVMPGARWFEGATLNFAEHLLGHDEDAPMTYAIIGSGNIGSAVAGHFARVGLDVAVAASRGPAGVAALTDRLGPHIFPPRCPRPCRPMSWCSPSRSTPSETS